MTGSRHYLPMAVTPLPGTERFHFIADISDLLAR